MPTRLQQQGPGNRSWVSTPDEIRKPDRHSPGARSLEPRELVVDGPDRHPSSPDKFSMVFGLTRWVHTMAPLTLGNGSAKKWTDTATPYPGHG